jgi:adenine-specific DNA methylase
MFVIYHPEEEITESPLIEPAGRPEKKYRKPDESDYDAIKDAEEKLNEIDKKLIPDEPLPPEGALGMRANLYGYETWGELFNTRQKLALATFCQKIQDLSDSIEQEDEALVKPIATYLAFVVGKISNRNSRFSVWGDERIKPSFPNGYFPMEWDYVESNPFSGWTGSWSYSLEYVTEAVKTTAYATGEGKAVLGDATRLPYPDDHFDAVLTDPPYYANIPYAHLADFFYVWLKRAIGHLYPEEFSTPLSPKSGEIIEDESKHDSDEEAEEFFERELTKSFEEINRVLTEDGITTIVFAHKGTEAWAKMIRGLLSSGFVVTATWPIHTERHSRPRSIESAALASSVYFVCRKRTGNEVGYYSDVQEELKDKVHDRLDYFWDQGIRGADLLVSAIGPATEVFGQYEDVKRLSGEQVTVDELLQDTQRLVSDYALEKVLEGDVALGNIDSETRFYILFRWAFANQDEDYDEVRKLAQVNNANVDHMERVGILEVEQGDARLVAPQSRNIDEPGEVPESNNLPLVEKIQRAAILWERGERESLKSFIEEHCMSEEFWRSAQAIAECLPEEESESKKEKQMLHGLLSYGGQTDFEGSGQSTLGKYTDGGHEQ